MSQTDPVPHQASSSVRGVQLDVAATLVRTQPSAVARHAAAVARSLTWAVESAEREDYEGALAWLRVIEATGDELPSAFLTQRRAWLGALAEQS